jgi:hypothetical protein
MSNQMGVLNVKALVFEPDWKIQMKQNPIIANKIIPRKRKFEELTEYEKKWWEENKKMFE